MVKILSHKVKTLPLRNSPLSLHSRSAHGAERHSILESTIPRADIQLVQNTAQAIP